ncbi:MAG: SDR family oxidoreductase [Bacteroidia bacterium]|nr:SDR family oxidoreductase [Bacteroidia bacterium]MCO5253713.1 SDR family oxidoreductase [Bacteroidota bacterium]MCZ2129157.1 SDR family oxidoreductase [Bacteroidia bacterium]
MQLKGKIAVVTGASTGLGAALATALVQKGAHVFGLARNTQALTKLKDKLGENFIAIPMDITQQENIATWANSTFSKNKLPDILINNAGIGFFKKIDETSSADWLQMIDTNLNGMYFITSQLVPYLKKNKNVTHIINIGSILGTMGREEGSAYCATKYAINGFSDALYKELRAYKIKVTCVNPGSIETDFFKNSGIEAHDNMLHPNDLAATIIHILETPDNMLINELTIRPLNPKQAKKL